MASGFTHEPQVGPCAVDPPVRGPRGAIRRLVSGPVRAGGRRRQRARSRRGLRPLDRPGRLRFLVPAQDEDAAMKTVVACAMCFGAQETSMIDGARIGVLVMLAVLFAVQGGFVAFFLYLRKRAKLNAEVELDTEWSKLQRSPS